MIERKDISKSLIDEYKSKPKVFLDMISLYCKSFEVMDLYNEGKYDEAFKCFKKNLHKKVIYPGSICSSCEKRFFELFTCEVDECKNKICLYCRYDCEGIGEFYCDGWFCPNCVEKKKYCPLCKDSTIVRDHKK